jgi:hypothetical protein
MSGTIMPIFIFGRDRAKLFFWQPKPLLAVGTRELVAFILGSIFLAVKSVFGIILPKIKVGTISAKNKSWQTQFFSAFCTYTLLTHFVWPHTTHTTEKHTKSTTHLTSPSNTSLHTPHLAVPEAPKTSVIVNMLPSLSPNRRRRP